MIFSIALNVGAYFLFPKFRIVLRPHKIVTTLMPMPETTVYKDHRLIFGKNNIRFSWKTSVIFSVSESLRKQVFSDKFFWFSIQDYRMDLFTDDSILNAFIEEYNFRTDYVLTGECFDSGSISRKIILNVERTMGSTCYLNCFLINQIGYDSRFDSVTFKSDLLDCIFQYKYNYLDIARSGTNLSAETKEVYRIPFSIDNKYYELKYIIGHQQQLGLLESFEMSGKAVVSLNSTDIRECYKIVILLERFMKFISNSSDVYFRRITFTDGVRPAAFFYCKSVSEKSSGGMDVFYHDFNVMKYVPKIIENLAKELGNRITESVTLGHIENYESMFTPQRFIEQIMAFEYLFEKLEPEKAKQRNFHLIDELELMLGVFPDVIAGVRKSTRKIADEIKNLRVDIVHGHAYYYDFANDHNIQYYMLMLDKLIERMNLKLVGFNDEEIKTFCSY